MPRDPAQPATHQDKDTSNDAGRRYARFLAMVSTSTFLMYLLTYTNVFQVAHIRFSEERVYMALTMGSIMAIVMIGYMWRMYPSRAANVAIVVASLGLAVVSFGLSQSQVLVEDVRYMQGMIPHHSIAILTSERSHLRDPRVQELADGIVATQFKEIAEMDWLLHDIAQHGVATTEDEAAARPVPSFAGGPPR